MKRCPVCASISADGDPNCGVCGKDLRGVPFGSADEKIPVQEQQAKTPLRKKNVDRNVTVVGLVLMISGLVILFVYRNQRWVTVIALALLIMGIVILALEAGGGGERKGSKRSLVPATHPT